jgi:acetyl/propionyl-CoA carboxylase alpha subunit
MIFDIEINGETRRVAVERAGGGAHRFRVRIADRTHVVDALKVESDTLSIILPESGQASHEVGFSRGLVPGELLVYLHGGTLAARVNGRRSRGGGTAAATGEQRIISPMPGRVLRVFVRRGDIVAARQALVVVEAMKMENELSSPRPGRVKEVAVAAGDSVEAGRLLVVVE